jgi:hypothetical protein
MPRWKDHHYVRAGEFAKLVAAAIDDQPAPTSHPEAIPLPRSPAPAHLPTTAAPTAAAVFKNIPWKK